MKKKLMLMMLLVLVSMFVFTGCMFRPSDKVVTIEPHQTVFEISLTGDSAQQEAFKSEEMLAKAMIPTQEYVITKYWKKLGVFPWQGEWRDTKKYITVDRTPVTREWTKGTDGTSQINQAIKVESKESITFYSGMNCTAEIEKSDTPSFLYRYNGKSLEEVMDKEIRPAVESAYAKAAGKYPYDEVICKKEEILTYIHAEVLPYFKERGITIKVLGYKGGLDPENKSIQESIDSKFKAEKQQQEQASINQKNKDTAEADAAVVKAKAAVINETLRLKEIEIKEIEAKAKLIEAQAKLKSAEKYQGGVPNVMINGGQGGNGVMPFMNIPVPNIGQ